LGLLPGRHRLLDQTLPLRRQPEGLCAGILAGYDLRAATLVPTIRKPFDVLAEGLVSEKSRGNKTSFELFLGAFDKWTKSLIEIAQALAS
jgi:hypothetical protein